jgi:hypothetical protein
MAALKAYKLQLLEIPSSSFAACMHWIGICFHFRAVIEILPFSFAMRANHTFKVVRSLAESGHVVSFFSEL